MEKGTQNEKREKRDQHIVSLQQIRDIITTIYDVTAKIHDATATIYGVTATIYDVTPSINA